MGYFSVEKETIYFGRAVFWTKICAMPVYPQGGIGNCTVEQLHSFAEEFINTQLVSRMDQQNWRKQVNFLLGLLK